MEVDAEGRVVASIVFDPDDRRAASAELLARDPRSDAVERAMSDHDLDRLRAALPDDFVLNDHRRTGLGQLGSDDYIASLAALFEQAPDVIIEPLYTVAVEEHGNLAVVRMFGTLADGGEFESVICGLQCSGTIGSSGWSCSSPRTSTPRGPASRRCAPSSLAPPGRELGALGLAPAGFEAEAHGVGALLRVHEVEARARARPRARA